MSLLQDAIELAVKYHSEQFRKSKINGFKIPYISHCFEVMKLVYKWGCGTEINLAVCAIHDGIEDTELTEKELIDKCGNEVYELVNELTFIPLRDIDRKTFKNEYLKSFKDKTINALIIKIADRICNVNDFLLTDKKYAAEYFGKAYCLIEFLILRKEEIINRYNNNVLLNIFEDIEKIKKELYSLCVNNF